MVTVVFKRRSLSVLSARAEVVRSSACTAWTRPRSLRASGGGPYDALPDGGGALFSPREQRWSAPARTRRARPWVLSARAEVVRSQTGSGSQWSGSLRASGGGPATLTGITPNGTFSPRERRWSGLPSELVTCWGVLSARAEVVRRPPRCRPRPRGSLRASGGDPQEDLVRKVVDLFSPREWRWFGVDDHVDVRLKRSPRGRGRAGFRGAFVAVVTYLGPKGICVRRNFGGRPGHARCASRRASGL